MSNDPHSSLYTGGTDGDADSQSGFSSDEPTVVSAGYSDLRLAYESEAGFSRIFRAKHHGKWVAIKTLRASYHDNPELKAMLKKEFEIGYTLDHPGIVHTLDFTELPEIGQCIVMEWIDGSTLREKMDKGDITDAEAADIVYSLMEALDYLHSLDVVHRDIKPENIIISAIGGHPRIIDFGLADTSGHHILKQAAGTPRYMPPEAYSGGSGATAADNVYAIGVIAGELNEALPHRSRTLSKIARQCCHKEPGKRPRNAKELKHVASSKRWFIPAAAIAIIALGVACGVYFMATRPDAPKAETGAPVAKDSITIVSTPVTKAVEIDREPVGAGATTKDGERAVDVAKVAAPPVATEVSIESEAPIAVPKDTPVKTSEISKLHQQITDQLIEYAKSSLERVYQEAAALRKKKNAPLVGEDTEPLLESHNRRLMDYAIRYKNANPELFSKARIDDTQLEFLVKRLTLSVHIDNRGNRFTKLFM